MLSSAKSKVWRYLSDDEVGAAAGLAADEALMLGYGRAGSAESRAALRLYTYRPHCALVGRYQIVEQEVDLERCAALGIEVGRRPTGGGAIIMGPAQLGVAIAASALAERTPRQALQHFAAGILASLAELGIEASFRSKNDLEVGGRKIAGLGIYLDPRGALLFHSSILVDLEIEAMLAVLKIPGAKLSDKAVSRVEERLTTVSREIGQQLQAADIRQQIAGALARHFDIELHPSCLSPVEIERYQELVELYTSEAWLHPASPRRDAQGRATLKTPAGLLRIHVGVHGGVLKSVLLAGDYNLLPAGIARLESALKWCRAEPRVIAEVSERCLDHEDLAIAPTKVAAAISKAVARAVRLGQRSYPRREAGSCYFPESETMPPPAETAEERRSHDPG